MISRESLARFGGPTAEQAKPEPAGGFDMDGYLSKHGFEVIRRKPWTSHPGGSIYELAKCPFNPDHTRGSAAFTTGDGKPGFRCQHDGCSGKTIKDVFAVCAPVHASQVVVEEPIHAEIERGSGAASKAAPVQKLDGDSIYRADYPEPVFLFDGLLANGLTILAGRPKSGKSWLTLQMAIDAAMQRPFLGRFGIKRAAKVLYLGLEEGPGRTHNRLRKLLAKPDNHLRNIEFRYELKSLAAGGATELDELLKDGHCDLLVIDTFLKIARVGGGSRDVMRSEYAEIAQLQDLAQRHKLAIVLVDHTRKMRAENGLDTVAGTSGKTAACDAVWTLRKIPTGDSVLEITGREMEERILGLRLMTGEDFGWRLTGEGAEVGMTEARQEIVELLKDEAALAPARIAGLLRKNAVTIRRLLQKLAGDDVVRKDSSGRYYLTSRICEQRERVNEVNEVSA